MFKASISVLFFTPPPLSNENVQYIKRVSGFQKYLFAAFKIDLYVHYASN